MTEGRVERQEEGEGEPKREEMDEDHNPKKVRSQELEEEKRRLRGMQYSR